MSQIDLITPCECCEGVESLVPVSILNRPGLASIQFREGVHGEFLASMLAAISSKESLRELGARTNPDFTISLMDSWAVVLDVLTFYQERIANEAFLGTAKERRSLLELANLIGYELRPGLAASVPLAFLLDTAKGSPTEVTIPRGTAAQSIPTKEEVPQTFETFEDLLARPRWNELKPRLSLPQSFSSSTKAFYISGVSANLRQGDPVLVVSGSSQTFERVFSARTQPDLARTLVRLNSTATPPSASYSPPGGAVQQPEEDSTLESLVSDVHSSLLDTAGILTVLATQGESIDSLIAALTFERAQIATPTLGGDGLYALRAAAAPFGHNAPGIKLSGDSWVTQDLSAQIITKNSAGTDYGSANTIYLDQEIKGVFENDWVVLSSRALGAKTYQVESSSIESIADFGLSGKSTRIVLKAAPGGNLNDVPSYKLRETSVFLLSELLPLAELPIESIDAGTTTLELTDIVPDLVAGRTVILSGEPLDSTGITISEELALERVAQGQFTTLYFTTGTQFSYRRETVRIFANVAQAGHGESKAEVIGSGDGSQAFQSFRLRFAPLTWISSSLSPTGSVSTLELRVGGIRWAEAPTFFGRGPTDRVYTIQIDNDAKATVRFGDGESGSRLPTGAENITALYRYGLGSTGLVAAERIALLPRKPLGGKSVTNPIASSGAQDPETLDDARQNAPLTVRTLDRIVSLFDFEDFARAFSGIGKARAEWIWDGARRVVHVTVAGPKGADLSLEVLSNLIDAMDAARVPHQPVRVTPFESLYFTVSAGLIINADYEEETVLKAAELALREAFSFDARDFAERAARSDVLAVLQRVEGVIAIDLDSLDYDISDGGNSPDDYGLPAVGARFDQSSGEILAAQLLLITPGPLDLRRLA